MRTIVPHVQFGEAAPQILEQMSPGLLISAWITAAPAPARIIGPFQVFDLTAERCSPPLQSEEELERSESLLLRGIENRLAAALEQSGFEMVREPGFADRIFLSECFVGFAYASVAEHLAETGDGDFDETGTLLDPILSARTLTVLAHESGDTHSEFLKAAERPLLAIQKMLGENKISNVQLDLGALTGTSAKGLAERQRLWLQRTWRRLVEIELPRASEAKGWPVSQDHCFARILLDHACGRPWREAMKPPAWRNAPVQTLIASLRAGEGALTGEVDLHDLNHRSLRMRGKLK